MPKLPSWVLDHAKGDGRSVGLIDEARRTGRPTRNRYYLWLTWNTPFDPSTIERMWSDQDHATPSLARARRAFQSRKRQLEQRLPLVDGQGHETVPA